LEAAARVIAGQGESASMADVAAEAGVARGTLYRYFPSREVLLDELADVAAAAAGSRLAAARLDEVSAREGVVRTVRAFLDAGDAFIAIAREPTRSMRFDELVAGPLRRLVERAQAEGRLRDDISAPWLAESLLALTVAFVVTCPSVGREDAVGMISGLYLDGAHARLVRSSRERTEAEGE
jgi:AcrR family transcriptional regulator